MTPALYLIPCPIGATPTEQVLPAYNKEVILSIRHFIVEEIRTARRFLKSVDRSIDIDALTFHAMGKHADQALFASYLEPLRRGDSTARRHARHTARGTVIHTHGTHGKRTQRTEFRLQRLPAHRPHTAHTTHQATRSARPDRTPTANLHRNTLPQPQNDCRHLLCLPTRHTPVHSSSHIHRAGIHPHTNHSRLEKTPRTQPRKTPHHLYSRIAES